jgi:GTPase
MANVIAIVGRPNVGKSTLFNQTDRRAKAYYGQSTWCNDAISHYGYGEWNGRKFTVIDTGGYVTGSDDVFEE